MGLVTKPFHLEAGNTARASELNDNFDAIIAQVNGNLQEVNLANGAVTENKIGDGEVKTAKIGDLQVTNAKVAANIDAVKIGAGTVTNAEFGRLVGVTADIQTQLNAKEGAVSLTANRAVRSGGDGYLAASDVTGDELGYLSGVTASIQNQLNIRVPVSRTITAGTGLGNSVQHLGADVTLAIAAGGVGPTQLASNAVTSIKIEGTAVTAAKLATGTSERDWVAARSAALAAGAVGSLAFANLSTGTVQFGATAAGSNLLPASADGNNAGNNTLSGTWRCLGRGSTASPTLWLRIS